MTVTETHLLEMWWARLSEEQRQECLSLELTAPLPRGHTLWSQPFLSLSGGMVPRAPGQHVDPRVSDFLKEKQGAADA